MIGKAVCGKPIWHSLCWIEDWGKAVASTTSGTWLTRLHWLYQAWMTLTFPLRWVVTHLFLAAVYFGVFTPLALLFRILGRDALQRRFQPAAPTYWQPKRLPGDMRQYLRQF